MRQPPKHVPLVVATRGGIPELVHVGSIAVVDHRGRLIHGVGDPESLNFARSTLKPLQALPLIEDGGMQTFGFTSHELALMCASHSGEAMHIEIVARMLERIDAAEADLKCGCHPPTYFSATHTQITPGAHWSPLFHNCSGKHAGFLAFCRLHRQKLARYLDPDSPGQRRVREVVTRFAPGIELPTGIDGCCAPNYALPLSRLAYAFCRIALGETAELAALAYAMTRHPDLVSGTGRSDLALMQAGNAGNEAASGPWNWVSKIGADGMQAIGVRRQGLGIAIRIADGNARALHVATIAVLQQLKLLDDPSAFMSGPLARLAQPELRNFRGTAVGRVVPVFTLDRRRG